MSDTVAVTIIHREDQQRLEARSGEGTLLGFAQYLMREGRYVFFHTEVDDAVEGQGVGSRLASGVLDFVADRGASLVPRCPFLRAYLRRHPERHDLLAAGVSLDGDDG